MKDRSDDPWSSPKYNVIIKTINFFIKHFLVCVLFLLFCFLWGFLSLQTKDLKQVLKYIETNKVKKECYLIR